MTKIEELKKDVIIFAKYLSLICKKVKDEYQDEEIVNQISLFKMNLEAAVFFLKQAEEVSINYIELVYLHLSKLKLIQLKA